MTYIQLDRQTFISLETRRDTEQGFPPQLARLSALASAEIIEKKYGFPILQRADR